MQGGDQVLAGRGQTQPSDQDHSSPWVTPYPQAKAQDEQEVKDCHQCVQGAVEIHSAPVPSEVTIVLKTIHHGASSLSE
jgi:hypothetical protein